MLLSKLSTGTSRTKRLHQDKFAFSLFWMSQCVACSPAWWILYHVTASCKGPIQSVVRTLQQHAQKTRDDDLRERLTELQNSLPEKIQRALELANEKGASSWLTVIPVKDLDFTLNKREFRDAIRLRYDWSIPDSPSVCVCGASFSIDHAIVCKRGGFFIQRHN